MDSNAPTPELLKRYCAVAAPDLAAGMWHRKDPGAKFYRQHLAGSLDDVVGHITGRHAVACRAADNAPIHWLSFDLDAMTAESDPRERYELLRRIMGNHHVPLVYRTPSGGLRVRYRIPATPIRELIAGISRGVVPDVLRGGGLQVQRGHVEVFPQSTQPDRLPLGPGMSLLDPDTLTVIAGCELEETFSTAVFQRALERLEAWYAHPTVGLIEHLLEAPRCTLIRIVSEDEFNLGTDADFVRAGDGGVRLTGIMAALANDGLTKPNSRFHAEFRIGMGMALRPEEFEPFGMARLFSQRQLAWAIARWLAERNNGYSAEWSAAVVRHRSTEGAITAFAARYLEPDSCTGLTMIDRIMRAVQAVDPQTHRIRQLTGEEWAKIFSLGERHFKPGSERLKFEVWAGACVRAVKEIIRYHEGRVVAPNMPRRFDALDDGFGNEWVQIELAAKWQEEWPYGSGGHGRRTPYLRYRAVLEAEGILRKVATHRPPRHRDRHGPDDLAGEAALYIVRRPADATLSDVPVAPWLLTRACADLTVAGRRCTLDHAYHALAAVSRGNNLRKRYGYSAAKSVGDRATALNASLVALMADPVVLFRKVA